MTALADLDREAVAKLLEELGADGWLLFDFHGCNPVANRILPGGMGTRRLFVWVPREGAMTAIVHRIEMQPFDGFAGKVVPYSRHTELHGALRTLLAGKTAAMEISPGDAVPYLDRIPWGVIDLLGTLGVKVVSSAGLVTRFAAAWTAAETAEHVKAAELLRTIALDALARAVRLGGTGYTESTMKAEVAGAIEKAGMYLDHGPIVGFGPNAAIPHYEPVPGKDRTLGHEEVVLLDLFAG
ncbi:MAG: M24 family metallopeptidase, partial [Gemmatimonadales bacterium]